MASSETSRCTGAAIGFAGSVLTMGVSGKDGEIAVTMALFTYLIFGLCLLRELAGSAHPGKVLEYLFPKQGPSE